MLGKEKEQNFVNPLDQRDGHIPSWADISAEFKLNTLPRGKRKLFRSFYRVSKFLALNKERKGRRLMDALDRLPHFRDFEDENANVLSRIAHEVRGVGH